MKTCAKILLALALVLTCLLTLAACGEKETPETETAKTTVADGSVEKTGVWATAKHLKDTTVGEGAKTLTVEVKAEDQLITLTVKTDEATVGAALLKEDLITGDPGDYGLYVKSVNGMIADYDVDQTYWAFYVDGEYAMSGVDSTAIEEGKTYRLERTK